MAISVSLLVSTVTVANSMLLEQYVYAIDNCDPTSTCTNTQAGTGNSQENNCIKSSTCSNAATGNENKQNNSCESVVLEARLDASILQKVIEIFRATLVSRLENSVGLLQLATTIPRQVFANQLMLPASILQMATTILKTTIVTQ